MRFIIMYSVNKLLLKLWQNGLQKRFIVKYYIFFNMLKYTLLLFSILVIFSCKTEQKNDIPGSHLKIINASEINKKIKNGNDIILYNATIIGNIDFTQAKEKSILSPGYIKHYISSSITINDCTIKGKVISHKKEKDIENIVKFNKNVCFYKTTFQDTVDFSYSDFSDLVSFSGSQFQKFTSFKSVTSSKNGFIFNKTRFMDFSKFNIMKISGLSDFSDAVFEKDVLFQSSRFDYPVRFASVKFNQNAVFTNVKFFDDVFFNYSEFTKNIKFNSSIFRGRTEFIKCRFNFISEFKNCNFYSKTLFNNAELTGIMSFENSIFYISDPENYKIVKNKESDFLTNNTLVLNKNTVIK